MSLPSPRKPLRVLISGAGIGGPVLAYWLTKAGHTVTVVERSPRLRKEGQTVDITGPAIQVIKWMNLVSAIRERTTKEIGVKFVDARNKVVAEFPQNSDFTQPSLTNEFEIVRGELAEVFWEASRGNEKGEGGAEYVFGESIVGIEGMGTHAEVTFASDGKKRDFDVVVVAEGLSSRTRALAFGEDVRAPIKPLHMWVVSFSFAQGKNDDQWARVYHIPQRRGLLIRPDGFGRARANACVIDDTDTILAISGIRDREKQKEHFISLFKGTGWETDRIMDGLREADDLYLQETAQAKNKTLSKGRVVLVGDAGYGPSPLSGVGCTSAIIGAYVLAAEIVQHQDNLQAGFAAYEATMRPYIEDIQSIPRGFPRLALPETQWGIRILHVILYLVSLGARTGVITMIGKIATYLNIGQDYAVKLPDPSVFEREGEQE
jgi:2-polyprenyl-6-methoxyphenol hydroxylase-like FAD-dependent oxidoreductase